MGVTLKFDSNGFDASELVVVELVTVFDVGVGLLLFGGTSFDRSFIELVDNRFELDVRVIGARVFTAEVVADDRAFTAELIEFDEVFFDI